MYCVDMRCLIFDSALFLTAGLPRRARAITVLVPRTLHYHALKIAPGSFTFQPEKCHSVLCASMPRSAIWPRANRSKSACRLQQTLVHHKAITQNAMPLCASVNVSASPPLSLSPELLRPALSADDSSSFGPPHRSCHHFMSMRLAFDATH